MKLIAAIYIIAAAANLGLNILVVPHLGILDAATTTVISCSLVLGLTTYYAFKEFKFDIGWRFIIKSLIASAAMSLAIWKMSPQGTTGNRNDHPHCRNWRCYLWGCPFAAEGVQQGRV